MNYWETIADNLCKAGWSWGCITTIDSRGRTIWITDARRDDGKRFIVRADEKLTACMELESAIRAVRKLRSLGAGRVTMELAAGVRVTHLAARGLRFPTSIADGCHATTERQRRACAQAEEGPQKAQSASGDQPGDLGGNQAGCVATLELRRSLAIACAKLDYRRAKQTKNEAME